MAASGETRGGSASVPEDNVPQSTWQWRLALLISFLPALVVGLSLFADDWQVCRDIASQVGVDPLVEACRPPVASDFLVLLLPVAVLLFPQIAEVAIPGLISLKRRVAEHEEQQKRLEQDIVRIQSQVTQRVENIINVDFETFAKKAARFIREDRPNE
jgi:hypothetical protein